MMLAVFAVSCTQAPITAPSVALNTATPHPETAIPIATDAPTAVHTPTKNSGSTLTATATRIPPTEPPTPTEPPRPMRVVFQRDFSEELDVVKAAADHWNYLHEDGTKVEIIPDPTDSSDLGGRLRGNVLTVAIHNDPVQHPDWAGSINNGGVLVIQISPMDTRSSLFRHRLEFKLTCLSRQTCMA
jgi:hypothetical protein